MPDAVGGKDQKKQRDSGGTQEACSKQRTNVAQPFFSSCGAVWLSVCGGVPVSLYQQLGCGSNLRGLYAQVPATGETGIQGLSI